MRHLIFVFVLLALALPAHASYTFNTGKHTYIVDVQNAYGRDIWGAWVNVNENGSMAYVSARANGYRDASGYVNVPANQQTIWVHVRMEDPTVWVQVTDRENHTINCWIDQNQMMADPNEYIVSIRMPAQGFTKFQRQDVQTDMFSSFIQVWGSDANKRVEMRIPRNAFGMSWTQNIRVQIPTDAELAQPHSAREVARLLNFQRLHAIQ